ncbi:MAG: Ras- protein Rab-2A [Thelocarpon superellum]|nr:MAG: Ras- protein Rab-2A [Thelocarpon superellum]
MSQPWDYIAKLVCIGDSGTGKSSLTIRLCEGRFSSTHDVTIGVEFGSRVVPVGPPGVSGSPSSPSPKHMKLSLWDTAGQETYKSVTRSYFRGASGALLVYDITRRATFTHVTDWLADLRQIADPDIVVVLVGNKSDLAPSSDVSSSTSAPGSSQSSTDENKRQVTREEAEEWCKANNVLKFVETSAKSGEGVERAFLEVAQRIWHNIEAGRYDLNDRRSGVKTAAARGVGSNTARALRLGMNDAAAFRESGAGWTGGCC